MRIRVCNAASVNVEHAHARAELVIGPRQMGNVHRISTCSFGSVYNRILSILLFNGYSLKISMYKL